MRLIGRVFLLALGLVLAIPFGVVTLAIGVGLEPAVREPERADELARRRLEPDADRKGDDAERDRQREAEREEEDPADKPHPACRLTSAPSAAPRRGGWTLR